jgi:hypothetical protein
MGKQCRLKVYPNVFYLSTELHNKTYLRWIQDGNLRDFLLSPRGGSDFSFEWFAGVMDSYLLSLWDSPSVASYLGTWTLDIGKDKPSVNIG